MIMRPRLCRGASKAERGPIMTRGELFEMISNQMRRRSDMVWRECIRITWLPNVRSNIWTSWLVRAISGTSKVTD